MKYSIYIYIYIYIVIMNIYWLPVRRFWLRKIIDKFIKLPISKGIDPVIQLITKKYNLNDIETACEVILAALWTC